MEIKFQTKEESNKAQQEAFLRLSKADRFYSFLHLMEKVSQFPTKAIKKNSTNFIIEITE